MTRTTLLAAPRRRSGRRNAAAMPSLSAAATAAATAGGAAAGTSGAFIRAPAAGGVSAASAGAGGVRVARQPPPAPRRAAVWPPRSRRLRGRLGAAHDRPLGEPGAAQRRLAAARSWQGRAPRPRWGWLAHQGPTRMAVLGAGTSACMPQRDFHVFGVNTRTGYCEYSMYHIKWPRFYPPACFWCVWSHFHHISRYDSQTISAPLFFPRREREASPEAEARGVTRGHDPFYEDWMDLDVVGEDEWQPVAPPLGEVQSYDG